MSNVKKGILEILAVVLVVFTVVFLLNAYNKGDIGNKAEKVAKSFSEQIEGSWKNKDDNISENGLSTITFKPDGQTTLNLLGVAVNGEYTDIYDIEKDSHTLELTYKTIAGITVDRKFNAKYDEEKDILYLADQQLDFVELELVRTTASEESAAQSKTTTTTTTAAQTKPVSENAVDKKTEKSLEALKKSLVGEWKDSLNSTSGYVFRDDSTVTISLFGVSTEGKYTLTIDETTGRPLLRITYAKVGISNINNGYFVTVEDGVMTLAQRGAEKISFTYNKV